MMNEHRHAPDLAWQDEERGQIPGCACARRFRAIDLRSAAFKDGIRIPLQAKLTQDERCGHGRAA
jgi:hypothetical protein